MSLPFNKDCRIYINFGIEYVVFKQNFTSFPCKKIGSLALNFLRGHWVVVANAKVGKNFFMLDMAIRGVSRNPLGSDIATFSGSPGDYLIVVRFPDYLCMTACSCIWYSSGVREEVSLLSCSREIASSTFFMAVCVYYETRKSSSPSETGSASILVLVPKSV